MQSCEIFRGPRKSWVAVLCTSRGYGVFVAKILEEAAQHRLANIPLLTELHPRASLQCVSDEIDWGGETVRPD